MYSTIVSFKRNSLIWSLKSILLSTDYFLRNSDGFIVAENFARILLDDYDYELMIRLQPTKEFPSDLGILSKIELQCSRLMAEQRDEFMALRPLKHSLQAFRCSLIAPDNCCIGNIRKTLEDFFVSLGNKATKKELNAPFRTNVHPFNFTAGDYFLREVTQQKRMQNPCLKWFRHNVSLIKALIISSWPNIYFK